MSWGMLKNRPITGQLLNQAVGEEVRSCYFCIVLSYVIMSSHDRCNSITQVGVFKLVTSGQVGSKWTRFCQFRNLMPSAWKRLKSQSFYGPKLTIASTKTVQKPRLETGRSRHGSRRLPQWRPYHTPPINTLVSNTTYIHMFVNMFDHVC